MRRIMMVLWLLVVLATPVFAADAAHGESEDSGSFLFGRYPGEYIWALVWFGAVLLVLWKFAWKPLLAGLTNRQEHIERQIGEAEKAKVEAKKVLDEYGAKLADAERQGRDIIHVRTKQAEEDAKEVAVQNQKQIEDVKIRAEAELNRERVEAEEQLWDQAGDIVRKLGTEVFGKSLDGDDNQKLIDEAIARLKDQHRE
jgi:F-type H+-transporting ATPase subunit b